MKRGTVIWILILTWVATSIAAILIINNHIDKKDAQLLSEIRNNIESLFENQSDGSNTITYNYGFFDSPMNGGKVRNFKRVEIPTKPKENKKEDLKLNGLYRYEDAVEYWKESYGDLASLWNLNWNSDDYHEYNDSGWEIVGIRCHGANQSLIHTFVIFPYQVGLKKNAWGNYFTVPDAVQAAYDFYTTDSKSRISDRFEKGSFNRLWKKIHDCNNEYYGIYPNENEKYHSSISGESVPGGPKPEEGGPVKNGWMHNGYYRVYIAASQETDFGIFKHPWNPDVSERNSLYLWSLGGLFIVFAIPLIIILTKMKKDNKVRNESLKERLLRKCSPSRFMSNYDKEKIDIANELYNKISSTDDENTLVELAEKARVELQINLIDSTEICKLKKRCNPANFMHPYDAKKVELANELYSILSKSNIPFSEFIMITEKIKELNNHISNNSN